MVSARSDHPFPDHPFSDHPMATASKLRSTIDQDFAELPEGLYDNPVARAGIRKAMAHIQKIALSNEPLGDSRVHDG